MQHPIISAIIVNYNAGTLLTETVGKILASPLIIKTIICDNNSTDQSLDYLSKTWGHDPRLICLKLKQNLGFAAANNRALPLIQSEYLLFLNPDCLLEPPALERLVEYLHTQPQVGIASCLILNPDGSEQVSCRRTIPTPGGALLQILGFQQKREPLPQHPILVEAVSGALLLVRRQALETVGPLDEGYFLHCEDLDWFVRFRQAGWQIAFLPDVKAVHHKGFCSKNEKLLVEYHKHRGMERFFRLHQAQKYSYIFSNLIIYGIKLHWILIASLIIIQNFIIFFIKIFKKLKY